ncbi:MAG: cell division protein FtsA [Prevotellaceae bacterium]|jgi:cell division protein FtsA|nr:cell division protein FtsA [Prevotellaceae bacterium]
MADYLVAIDLGTTKIVSIVGEKTKNSKRLKILAYSEGRSSGIRHGQVENIHSVVGVVKNTLDSIKTTAGISDINEVYVGIAGLNIRYIVNRTEILRPIYEELITENDIKMLEDNARRLHINMGEKIVHVIPQTYSIDDIHEITDPVGRLGYKLAGNFMVIIEKGVSTRHTEVCIERLNLSLKELILEPMASARAVLSDDEREMGVVMVDMGGGTTDLIIFHKNVIRHTAIIPFGGNTVTQDIKTGCKITWKEAENIKIQRGSCMPAMVPDTEILIPGENGKEPYKISFKLLACIIEARIKEILDMIFYEIRKYTDNNHELATGIVFTGGAAQIANLREFVKLKTGMDVRIGKPMYVSESSPKDIVHPKYSTAVGLVMYGFDIREKYAKLVEIKNTDTVIVNPVVPVNPVDPVNPVNPVNPVDPVDPVDPGNSDIKMTLKSVMDMFKNVLYEKKEKV